MDVRIGSGSGTTPAHEHYPSRASRAALHDHGAWIWKRHPRTRGLAQALQYSEWDLGTISWEWGP